jgi:hypothetical protein
MGTLLAASLLVAAGALFGSASARAEPSGGDTEGDATHAGVYATQTGGYGSDSSAAYGRSAAVPADLPGYYRYSTGKAPKRR